MVNTEFNSTEKIINKLLSLKRTIKLKSYQYISSCYDEMIYRSHSDIFQNEDLFFQNCRKN